jgi:ABC-type glutathione transport system ATPase component
MQKARLVLLDEPMAGMSAAEKSAMTELLQRVREKFGMSFLIVEHDIPVIMDISSKIVVLDFGRKIAEGTGSRPTRRSLRRTRHEPSAAVSRRLTDLPERQKDAQPAARRSGERRAPRQTHGAHKRDSLNR